MCLLSQACFGHFGRCYKDLSLDASVFNRNVGILCNLRYAYLIIVTSCQNVSCGSESVTGHWPLERISLQIPILRKNEAQRGIWKWHFQLHRLQFKDKTCYTQRLSRNN